MSSLGMRGEAEMPFCRRQPGRGSSASGSHMTRGTIGPVLTRIRLASLLTVVVVLSGATPLLPPGSEPFKWLGGALVSGSRRTR